MHTPPTRHGADICLWQLRSAPCRWYPVRVWVHVKLPCLDCTLTLHFTFLTCPSLHFTFCTSPFAFNLLQFTFLALHLSHTSPFFCTSPFSLSLPWTSPFCTWPFVVHLFLLHFTFCTSPFLQFTLSEDHLKAAFLSEVLANISFSSRRCPCRCIFVQKVIRKFICSQKYLRNISWFSS